GYRAQGTQEKGRGDSLMFSEPGTARQEAERLVAAGLAAAALAANAHPQLSPGSAGCCVCPLCKVIPPIRDPDPAMVERLATGAGDLAAGVASFMRHVAGSQADHWQKATEEAAPKKVVKKKVVAKKAVPKKAG